jgi:hypothetical protein
MFFFTTVPTVDLCGLMPMVPGAISVGGKWSGHEAHSSLSFTILAENMWNYTFSPPIH